MVAVTEAPRRPLASVLAWLSGVQQSQPRPAGERGEARPAAQAADLSSDHISPQQQEEDNKDPEFTYANGGNYVRVRMPGQRPFMAPPGKRGKISGFSPQSQRAVLALVNSVDQSACEAGDFAFASLTYARDVPTARATKRDLDAFIKRFEREFGQFWLIWKLEPQKRGAPHYHLLIYLNGQLSASDLCTWTARAWFEIAGHGNPHHLKFHLGQLGNRPCVETVRDFQGVSRYAGKYLGKVSMGDEEWQHPGRFWGERRHDLAPITMVTEQIEHAQAVQLRRGCVRFYESQKSGWFYESGKRTSRGKDKPGRRIHKRELAPGGDLSKLTAAYLADRAEELERPIRALKRRWRPRVGGFSGFMQAATFQRLITWSKQMVSAEVTANDRITQHVAYPPATQGACLGGEMGELTCTQGKREEPAPRRE